VTRVAVRGIRQGAPFRGGFLGIAAGLAASGGFLSSCEGGRWHEEVAPHIQAGRVNN